jgi:leucyl aminopeptidase
MQINFTDSKLPKNGTLVLMVAENKTLLAAAKQLDGQSKGLIKKAIDSGAFTGKRNQYISIPAPAGLAFGKIILMGVGKTTDVTASAIEAMGGNLYGAYAKGGDKSLQVMFDAVGSKIDVATAAAHFALGMQLRSYRFDKYLTKEKPENKPTVTSVTILVKGAAKAKAAFGPLEKIASGIVFTRNVVNEPPNVIYPESFAAQAKQLSKLGVKVEVLDEKQMKALGMGALLGVAQGSVKPARLIVMQWMGAKNKKAAPVALIGKGVTFDTGGISIKPAAGMEDMKWDMAGAGAVTGAMMALAARKAKANVVGICGMVENMPDGNAQRPSDIVTTMSGMTVEVLNTDAEGRMVLCDAMWYAQQRFKPKVMVDLATLTGAIVVALGSEYAGLFSNDNKLSKQLTDAGEGVGEKLWRMPMCDAYDREIDGFQSDLKHIGNGREAGSATAAHYLGRFVQKDVAWAHLDIAGVAWAKKDGGAIPRGASAFGVRLLDRFIAENFE